MAAQAIFESSDAAFDYGHVIHLDSRCFNARLPDRDQLLDMRDSAQMIAPWVRNAMSAYVRRMKTELDATAFVARFDTDLLGLVGCLDLLNDIPLIAADKCHWMTMEDDAVLMSNADPHRHYWARDTMVTREEIEAADLVISRAHYNELYETFEDTCHDDEIVSPTLIYLACFKTVIVSVSVLDEGHWIHPLLSTVDTTGLRYHATGRVVTQHLQSEHFRFEATICDAVEMNGPLGTVCINDWAVPQGDDNPVLLPAKSSADAFQAFISFWDGDNDEFDTAYFNTVTSELIAQVRAIHSDDMSRVVAATLRESSIATLDTIRNKRFTVSFDELGQLTVENAA